MIDLLCAARCRGDTPNQAAPGYRLCWACHGWQQFEPEDA